MIRFVCPACGTKYKVGEEFAGRRTKCRKCEHALQVPTPQLPPAMPPPPVAPEPQQLVPAAAPVPPVIPQALAIPPVPIVSPAPLVTFTADGQILVSARNEAEAKLAIRQLRVKKRELSVSKRAIVQQQREIRAAYTDLVRQRGSKFIGGGTVGRVIRTVQTVNRDAARRQLANDLAPFEEHRARIEAYITAIDSVIIQLQSAIL